MNVHFPLLLLLGCIIVLWLRRYIVKSSRGFREDPSLQPHVNWETTYRFLPVPQCNLKIDDPSFLNWLTSWISGNDKYQEDNSLPNARNNRSRRSAARGTRPGSTIELNRFSYDYLSPTIAVLGILCAISLLIYQAGWTISAITDRIRDDAGQPTLTYGNTATVSQPSPRTIDTEALSRNWPFLKDTIFASKHFRRSISEVQYVDTVEGHQPSQGQAPDESGTMVQPLIPGITVPLSHTFPLLLALLVSQVIHEAGHLVAAALHNILPIRVTLGVWAIFPFAAVVLPSSVDNLPPKSLLRIAAAGPYHNLLTYFTILLLPLSGIQYLFYQDISSQGVFVTRIHDASPLRSHLPRGAIVRQLDDVSLGTAFQKAMPLMSPVDTWTAYLLRGNDGIIDDDTRSQLDSWGVNRGWCIAEESWKDSSQPPCPPSTGIRFSRVEEPPETESDPKESNRTVAIPHRCFAAYPILTTPTVDCSICTASKGTSKVCVRPLVEERILRIHYITTGNGVVEQQGDRVHEQVLLFAGDPETVYADIATDALKPRGGKVFAWAVTWGDVVIMYVATLSLALATLNLLPLPQLDGTHILSAMLSLTFGSSSQEDGGDEYDRLEADDMELGDGTTSLVRNDTVNAREKKRRWHQIVTWATGGLAVTCVGGGVILGLL